MNELNIPESWAETEVGNAISLKNGFAFKSKDFLEKGVHVIRISNIQKGFIQFDNTKKIETNPVYDESFLIESGDLLVAMSGATTGKMGIFEGNEKAYSNQRVGNLKIIVEGSILKQFRNYYFENVSSDILAKAYGGAQPNISGKMIEELILPIPPIKEQERIVQKIESCFEKLNATEQSLIKVETLLEKYRESLLAKAFRGEFTPQNDNDEPASVLLEKIRIEREKTVSAKKKKVQVVTPITSDEMPFDIPDSWEWVRLEEVCSIIADIDHQMPKAKEKGVIFLSAKDLKNSGILDFSSPKYISREDFDRLSRKIKPQKNDIIYSRIGARLGKARVVEVDTEFLVSYSCCTMRPIHSIVDVYFLNAFLDSGFVLKQALRDVKGIGVPDLGMAKIKNFAIPLPPKNVQSQIVEILKCINENMSENRKYNKHKLLLLSKLRESVLAKAFEGQLVEQINSEGTGQELLEKIIATKEAEKPVKKTKKKTAKKSVKKKNTRKKTSKKK